MKQLFSVLIFMGPALVWAQNPMEYESTPTLGEVYSPSSGNRSLVTKPAPNRGLSGNNLVGDDKVTGDDLKEDKGLLNDWWNAKTLKALGARDKSSKALEKSLSLSDQNGFDAWLEFVRRYAKTKPKEVGDRLLNAPLSSDKRFVLQMTFVRYMRSQDPELAVAYLNAMLGSITESYRPVVLLTRGQLLKDAGAYPQAITDLTTAASDKNLAADQSGLARFLLGELYMRPGSSQNFRFAYNQLKSVSDNSAVSASLRELARERMDQVASLLLNTD